MFSFTFRLTRRFFVTATESRDLVARERLRPGHVETGVDVMSAAVSQSVVVEAVDGVDQLVLVCVLIETNCNRRLVAKPATTARLLPISVNVVYKALLLAILVVQI